DHPLRRDVALRARIGVNTGQVVFADLGGERTAVGDAVNIAARLQAACEPGGILIGEQTAGLVPGRVRLEEGGPIEPPGRHGPGTAYRLLEGDAAMAAGTRVVRLSPFVGREPQLAALGDLLDQAAAGEGQVVGIMGEAGMGKSRLLLEFSGG